MPTKQFSIFLFQIWSSLRLFGGGTAPSNLDSLTRRVWRTVLLYTNPSGFTFGSQPCFALDHGAVRVFKLPFNYPCQNLSCPSSWFTGSHCLDDLTTLINFRENEVYIKLLVARHDLHLI